MGVKKYFTEVDIAEEGIFKNGTFWKRIKKFKSFKETKRRYDEAIWTEESMKEHKDKMKSCKIILQVPYLNKSINRSIRY